MNLENFPENETAKRFLTMVSPIYDESFVGKWLYEVMGIELGAAVDLIRGLVNEAFPETATWTLPYWEEMYGLQTNSAASIEQRRKAILEIRDFKRPMNPARIEQIIQKATDRNVLVIENTAPGCYEVKIMDGISEASLDKIRSLIREVKQSNKHVDIVFETPVQVRIRADPQIPGYGFPYTVAGTVPDVNTPGKLDEGGIATGITSSTAAVDYKICGATRLRKGGY